MKIVKGTFVADNRVAREWLISKSTCLDSHDNEIYTIDELSDPDMSVLVRVREVLDEGE